jgi:hypothetical protein
MRVAGFFSFYINNNACAKILAREENKHLEIRQSGMLIVGLKDSSTNKLKVENKHNYFSEEKNHY